MKYEASVYNVITPQGVVMSALTNHYAESFATELNALLARAEQAERDRDVLGEEVKAWRKGDLRLVAMRGPSGGGNRAYQVQGAVVFWDDTNKADALSRCTPPASKEDKSC